MGVSVGEVARRAGVTEAAVRKQLAPGGLLKGELSGEGRRSWSIDERSAEEYVRHAGAGRTHRQTATVSHEPVVSAVVPAGLPSVNDGARAGERAGGSGRGSAELSRVLDENRRLKGMVAALTAANRSLNQAVIEGLPEPV